MKEVEAYERLGWPVEGSLLGFILPVCNSEEDCAFYTCPCKFYGIVYGHHETDIFCCNCNRKLELVYE
jgi:hypothetical protein